MNPDEIRQLREDRGLSQQDFATKLGVSVQTVHRWETGKSRPSRLALAKLRELAGAVGAPAP